MLNRRCFLGLLAGVAAGAESQPTASVSDWFWSVPVVNMGPPVTVEIDPGFGGEFMGIPWDGFPHPDPLTQFDGNFDAIKGLMSDRHAQGLLESGAVYGHA